MCVCAYEQKRLQTSPRVEAQTWDLDAIVKELGATRTNALIHIMDMQPRYLYSSENKCVTACLPCTLCVLLRFWPVIDNAIREAVLRGVKVKIITAALHFPKIGLSFLKSNQSLIRSTYCVHFCACTLLVGLQQLNDVTTRGSVEVVSARLPCRHLQLCVHLLLLQKIYKVPTYVSLATQCCRIYCSSWRCVRVHRCTLILF